MGGCLDYYIKSISTSAGMTKADIDRFVKNQKLFYKTCVEIFTDNLSRNMTQKILGHVARIQHEAPKNMDDFKFQYQLMNKSASFVCNIPYRFRQSIIGALPSPAIEWIVNYRNEHYGLEEKTSEYVYSSVSFSYITGIPTKILGGLGVIKAIPLLETGGAGAVILGTYLALVENPLRFYLQKNRNISTGLILPWELLHWGIKKFINSNGLEVNGKYLNQKIKSQKKL